VHHRVFELKEETAIFLSDDTNNDEANLCYSENFIQKLAYLVDTSEILCNMYKPARDFRLIFSLSDTVKALTKIQNCKK
jgi:hypothetical protein